MAWNGAFIFMYNIHYCIYIANMPLVIYTLQYSITLSLIQLTYNSTKSTTCKVNHVENSFNNHTNKFSIYTFNLLLIVCEVF